MRCVVALVVIAPLLACGGETPPGEPVAKSSASSASSATGAPAPTTTAVPTLKVGQWARYRVRQGGRTTGTSTYRVSEQSGEFHTVEFSSTMSGKTSVVTLQADFRQRKPVAQMTIKSASVQMPNAPVKRLEGEAAKNAVALFGSAFDVLTLPSYADLPREDATVPGGVYKQCYKQPFTRAVMTVRSSGHRWLHPAVPISGLVRQETKSGPNAMTLELEAFGNK